MQETKTEKRKQTQPTIIEGFEELGIFAMDKHAWTTSRAIAASFEKLHKNIMMMIDNLIAYDVDNWTELNFKLSHFKDSSGKRNRQYLLNRKGAMFVIMRMTGPKATAVQTQYIDAFEAMESLIHSRGLTSELHHDLTEAIRQSRLREGEEIKPYNYSNELNMINSIILGMQSKKYRKIHDIPASTPIRDTMTKEQLDKIATLEQFDAQLLHAGEADYDTRKKLLKSYYVNIRN